MFRDFLVWLGGEWGKARSLFYKKFMKKIIIPPTDSKNRRHLNGGTETIELHDKHLRIIGSGSVIENNESLNMMQQTEYDYDIYVDKDAITSIRLIHNNDEECYEISIIHNAVLCTMMQNKRLGEVALKALCEWRWDIKN